MSLTREICSPVVHTPPNKAKVTRIRRLIHRIKGDIADLDDTERARVDNAVAIVRRHRAPSQPCSDTKTFWIAPGFRSLPLRREPAPVRGVAAAYIKNIRMNVRIGVRGSGSVT